MAIDTYVDRYKYWRYSAFRWRSQLSMAQKIGLALGMAGLTGLLAQVRIPLWFTPVPLTGQVFAVLLSGVLLGAGYGSLSQALYLVIGACGVHWYQGWAGGISYLSHTVTLGYLIGFIMAPLIVGGLTERYIAARRFLPQLGIMIVGAAIILACGAAYFSAMMHTGVGETIKLAVLPFVPLDMAKAAAVAAISTALLPKASYTREVDKGKYPASY
jgi:biotin transport system substrate-specific component